MCASLESQINHNAEFYVYNDGEKFAGFDTVRIEDGKFRYEKALEGTEVLTLLYPNFSRTLVVAEPGTTIHITGDAGKLSDVDVSGTESNERLSKFRHTNQSKPASNVRMAAAQYVRDNAATPDGWHCSSNILQGKGFRCSHRAATARLAQTETT